MSKSKILFQMTGSIACFKACQAISKLVQAGMEVQVVASPSALQFVGNATIEGLTGKPVVSDLYQAGNVMDHIHLVRWADLILVAPATANYINKVAHGVGDDLLTTQFLAHDFQKPFLIAPAMNTKMYLHPVTQNSIQSLRKMGVEILETASGVLACGEVGWGRLLEPDLITQEVLKALQLPDRPDAKPTASETTVLQASSKPEARLPKILMTSGGTQESIDAVRVLTNTSTGKTGASLADTLVQFGFEVTYLHGTGAQLPQSDCQKVAFTNFESLSTQLRQLLSQEKFQAVVHLAAVSDFTPIESSEKKISSEEDLVIRFKRNPKLVDQLKEFAHNPALKVIAFKLTAQASEKEKQEAIQKLFAHSHADLVVQNDTSEMTATEHLFHLSNSKQKIQTLRGKQELGFFLGEYLMKELL
jgi:phosphopantothenoylcysteine decarboxylase/phosphopantothenate--cysteine ligase